MLLGEYKNIKLINFLFVSNQSQKPYPCTIPQSDSFFKNLKVHNGSTEISIGAITIFDPEKTFFKENSFTLSMDLLVSPDGVNYSAITRVIDKVFFKDQQNIKNRYENEKWYLEQGILEIAKNVNIYCNEEKETED